jgi:hypothetical protein
MEGTATSKGLNTKELVAAPPFPSEFQLAMLQLPLAEALYAMLIKSG